MPVVPFIPLIAQGVGMFAGGKVAKKRQEEAMKRSPEEQIALGGAQRAGGQLLGTGTSLIGEGRPQTRAAANYYDTLLRGSRARQQQAIAPYAAQIGEQSAGAQRSLEHAGLRGAARDQAMGQLARGRASQISGLVTGMQPWAAGQVGQMGQENIRQGSANVGAGGDIYGNLLGPGFENRKYAREEGGKAGAAIGGLIGDFGKVLGGVLDKDKDGGGGGWGTTKGPGPTGSTPVPWRVGYPRPNPSPPWNY